MRFPVIEVLILLLMVGFGYVRRPRIKGDLLSLLRISCFNLPIFHSPNRQSAQLLESLHLTDTPTCMTTPTGMLIANDSDHKRYVRIHNGIEYGG
jgi:hypothetical protein